MLPVRRCRVIVLFVALALVAAACAEPAVPEIVAPAIPTPTPPPTATPAPTVVNQPTPTPRPFEQEPGVTEDTIRIGVIYDTGVNDVADQMARSAPEAVEAWARSVNTEGGVAGGRTVEVVRIETQPLLGDHADAIDRACNSGLFALVGSTALFDSLGVEQLESPACGLPDFPSLVYSRERLASAVTTATNPIMADIWQAGWARHFVEAQPEAALAAATMYLEFPISIINGERTIEAATAQGYEFVYREEMAFDTDFVAEAAALDAAGAELLTWRSDGGRLIALLRAIDDAQVDIGPIDCGIMCYSDTWVEAAGGLGQGVRAWLPTLPFEESDSVPELVRYLFWRGSTSGADGSEPTSIGTLAWASALLFEEAVNIAIGQDTEDYDPNNITRAGVIAAANTITDWDARGLHGPANPADGVPSSCFVLLRLRGGAWRRVFPDQRGALDCNPDNLVPLSITLRLGEDDEDLELPAESEQTPTPVEGDVDG